MKKIKFIIIALFCWFLGTPLFAAAITSLYVGQTGYLTAPNPPGSNTALYNTAWSSTCAHLTVSKYQTYGAKVTINDYFTETAEVRCDYYYYWYDNNGRQYTKSATTYFYVNCNSVNVTVSPSTMQLNIGEGKYLNYSYSPSNVSPAPTIRFSSSNSNIVTVNNNGYVSAVSTGSATIKLLNSSGPDVTCSVVVRNTTISPSSIIVSPTSATMEIGDRKAISYTLYPSNASSPITWSSSNASVATVSTNGIVTAISAGKASVTASTNNGLSASCSITVNDATSTQPTSISLSPTSANLEVGETKNLTYTLTPSTATTTVTWSSSNTSVATVNSSGKVTAVSAGTATITAKTSNNKTATCSVTVTAATLNQPTSVTFSRSSMSIEVGNTATLTPIFYPAGTTAPLIWGSLDESVATVNNGVVTALKEGLTYIGAYNTSLEIEAICEVTVTDPNSTLPTSISLSPTSMNLTVGEYKYIYESFYPEGTTADITWSSNKTSVATVNSYGKVTAVSAGTATITAKTSNNKTATCSVTVTAASTQPTSISVSPSSVNLEVGGTKNLTYTLSPSTATTTTTWSSSNTSVATVSSAGKVTAVSAGSATITAKTNNNKTATCSVSVVAKKDTVSGTCGNDLVWMLVDSVLTISGTGNMTSYSSSSDDRAPWYTYRSLIKNVIIKDSVTSIGSSAFYTCSGLTSVTIPNSVTSIERYAFDGCSSLTSVTIPYSVTSIGNYAFYNCSGLTSVTIPNSVTSIGNYAFAYCSGLTSVTIPNSVTSIGNDAFYKCSSLTSVTIPNSVTSIGNYAFYYCSDLTSVTIPNSVTSIGEYAFAYCSGMTSVTIPYSVTSIGNYAFYNCSSLTSVTIPNSVTSIGNYAFYYCRSLTSVTIPNSVTSIGNYTFAYCSGLTSVTIPNSVTSIGNDAFYKCSSLTSVTIPNSVTSIGEYAFESCFSLTSITCYAQTPPTISSSSLYGILKASCKLFVPNSSVSTYKATNYWKEFTNILPIDPTLLAEYEAYQTSLVDTCEAITEDLDSKAVLEMIDNATYAIQSFMYDAGKSMEDNKAVLDAIVEKLQNEVASARATYRTNYTEYQIYLVAICDALTEDSDSEDVRQLISNAKMAILRRAYNSNQTLDANEEALDAIVEQLREDIAAARAAYKSNYEAYRESLISLCDSMANEDDEYTVWLLIANAKVALMGMEYDDTQTYDDNKAALDAIIEQLREDIAAERHQDIEDVNTTTIPQKILRDGQIYILRGDKTYTTDGRLVR